MVFGVQVVSFPATSLTTALIIISEPSWAVKSATKSSTPLSSPVIESGTVIVFSSSSPSPNSLADIDDRLPKFIKLDNPIFPLS